MRAGHCRRARCLRGPVKKRVISRSEAARVTESDGRGVSFSSPFFSGCFFAERARPWFSIALLRIHAIPNIHGREAPRSAADPRCWPLSSFSGTLLTPPPPPQLCCITGSFRSIPSRPFQKSSCSHSKHGRRSYIKRWQRLIGPNARRGSAESQCITTAVPLIGKVSPIGGGHD